MFFRKKINLLPYTSEEINNFYSYNPQQAGWEITQFDIPNIWKKTQGKDVKVAVIDTGCDLDHPDLKDNMLPGINIIQPKKDPEDDNGHGSHVASTIAAINNGLGIVGVAPQTKIVPIKALDSTGAGNTGNVAKSIIAAADYGGVDFITMSLGSPGPVKEIENAINYASSKGCIIFCAAGNSGPNTDIMYPAKYPNTISIGAIDRNLNRTSFTCSGDSLDFLAPGHDILGCIPGGRYALMSGTSMSNPFAVGCAALLLSYNKVSKKYILKSTQDYVKILSQHTIKLSDQSHQTKKYQGYGILNPVLLFK